MNSEIDMEFQNAVSPSKAAFSVILFFSSSSSFARNRCNKSKWKGRKNKLRLQRLRCSRPLNRWQKVSILQTPFLRIRARRLMIRRARKTPFSKLSDPNCTDWKKKSFPFFLTFFSNSAHMLKYFDTNRVYNDLKYKRNSIKLMY